METKIYDSRLDDILSLYYRDKKLHASASVLTSRRQRPPPLYAPD